jgi:ribosomal protein L37E
MADDYHKLRLLLGEAYMMCNECGSRLWSFDGNKDSCVKCPYKEDNKCKYN